MKSELCDVIVSMAEPENAPSGIYVIPLPIDTDVICSRCSSHGMVESISPLPLRVRTPSLSTQETFPLVPEYDGFSTVRLNVTVDIELFMPLSAVTYAVIVSVWA